MIKSDSPMLLTSASGTCSPSFATISTMLPIYRFSLSEWIDCTFTALHLLAVGLSLQYTSAISLKKTAFS